MLAIFHHLIQFSEVTHEIWQRCACYTLHSTYNSLKNTTTYILWEESGWKYRVTVIEGASPFRHCLDLDTLVVAWSRYKYLFSQLWSGEKHWLTTTNSESTDGYSMSYLVCKTNVIFLWFFTCRIQWISKFSWVLIRV